MYSEAKKYLKNYEYAKAIKAFETLKNYKDSFQMLTKVKALYSNSKTKEIIYVSCKDLESKQYFYEAYQGFSSIKNYKDSCSHIKSCLNEIEKMYQKALDKYKNYEDLEARDLFYIVSGYKDAIKYLEESEKNLKERKEGKPIEKFLITPSTLIDCQDIQKNLGLVVKSKTFRKRDKIISFKKIFSKLTLKILIISSIVSSLTFLYFKYYFFGMINKKKNEIAYSETLKLINNGDYDKALEKLQTFSYLNSEDLKKISKAGLSFYEGNYNDGIRLLCEGKAPVTIAYDANGGRCARDYDHINKYEEINNPCTKSYYNFISWEQKDFEIGVYDNKSLLKNYGEVHLIATYSPISYSLTYELIEGENDERNPSNYTVESNDIYLYPAKKDGYNFLYWTYKGRYIEYIKSGSFGDMILKAKYEKKDP